MHVTGGPQANLGSTERQAPALEDPDSRNGAAVVGSLEKDTGKGILLQLSNGLEQFSDKAAAQGGLGSGIWGTTGVSPPYQVK